MSRGRGQPPKINPDRYPQLLELLRAGRTMAQAAAELDVTRQTLYNLAKQDEDMGKAIRAARAAGRIQHGTESCYVKRHCRRPECTAAATAARAARRDHTAAGGARPSVYELADTVGPFPERPAPPAGLADTA